MDVNFKRDQDNVEIEVGEYWPILINIRPNTLHPDGCQHLHPKSSSSRKRGSSRSAKRGPSHCGRRSDHTDLRAHLRNAGAVFLEGSLVLFSMEQEKARTHQFTNRRQSRPKESNHVRQDPG